MSGISSPATTTVPRFSVIVPTYNRAGLLPETLDSIRAQTFSDYEVIVVDDGSSDHTAAVVRARAPACRYLRQENRGPGAARNLGIAQAKGEFVAFLDSDDLWFPWALATYHQAITSSANPAFISGREVKFRTSSDLPRQQPSSTRVTAYRDYLSSSGDALWVLTSAVALRTSALREIGGFTNEHYVAEDSDLWLQFGTAPGFLRIESPPVFGYRQTPGSEITDRQRVFRGLAALLAAERLGAYPGGRARRLDRWRILSRHVRPGSIELLKARHYAQAFTLYRQSLRINCALKRTRYLLGFWLLLLRKTFD